MSFWKEFSRNSYWMHILGWAAWAGFLLRGDTTLMVAAILFWWYSAWLDNAGA